MPVAPAASQNVMTLQGITVPASAIDPPSFFAATRRQNLLMKSAPNFAGFGVTDQVPILQTGIISQLRVRVFGTLTSTPGSGTVNATYQWPYNLIRALRVTANGQSNLINVSGWALKLFRNASRFPLDDRGVPQAFGGAYPGTAATQGTLSLASESWGVGSGVTAISAGSYDVELVFEIPVAYDPITLTGAIFAQTQSTDIELAIDWNQIGNLFTLTGNAAVTFNPSYIVEGEVFTIPSVNGGIVLPKLDMFHSLVESRAPNAVGNGANEITLAGQGTGRQLMRLAFRTWNSAATVYFPLAMNLTNYTALYWRFGGNTTPETFADGRMLRAWDEMLYNSDVGALAGYGVFDFSSMWAQRDSIDEGSATQLRFGYSIPNGVTLVAPYAEYVQQALVAGAMAA